MFICLRNTTYGNLLKGRPILISLYFGLKLDVGLAVVVVVMEGESVEVICGVIEFSGCVWGCSVVVGVSLVVSAGVDFVMLSVISLVFCVGFLISVCKLYLFHSSS